MVGFGFFWVIKLEYYFGAKPFGLVLTIGFILIVISLFVGDFTISALLGIFAGTVLWGAIELPHQEERVRDGIFPVNPARAAEYSKSGVQSKHSHGKHGG
ncbi:MAG: DUF4491 family protein [Anaerolineae bacterium]|nr:DUF4491 family protein [Anaerolineae bacterium]